jgi:hypothetical protein
MRSELWQGPYCWQPFSGRARALSSRSPRHYPRFGILCQSPLTDKHRHIRSQFPFIFPRSKRVAWSILECACRTSTFLSCAFREQEDDQATRLALFQHFHGRAVQKDCPARPQAEQEPEAYPLGYVEDSCELRTPLAGFFNSLQELVLRHAIPERIAGDLEEPTCFGDVASCAL